MPATVGQGRRGIGAQRKMAVQRAHGGAVLNQAHDEKSSAYAGARAYGRDADCSKTKQNTPRAFEARRGQAMMRGLRIDDVRSANIGVSQLIPAKLDRLSTYQDASRRCCTRIRGSRHVRCIFALPFRAKRKRGLMQNEMQVLC